MLVIRNFVFLTLLSILVMSCSKDEKSIVGDWIFMSFVSANCTDSEENGTINFTNGCFKESAGFFEVELCGTAVFTDKNYTITFVTSFLGENSSETETGTYTIDGDKITLTATNGDKTEGTVNGDRNSISVKSNDIDTGCDQTITLGKK